jgi:hypothetical protein
MKVSLQLLLLPRFKYISIYHKIIFQMFNIKFPKIFKKLLLITIHIEILCIVETIRCYKSKK